MSNKDGELSFSSVNSNNSKGSSSRGDVYSRNQSSSSAGRGSLSGWTTCPLCPPKRNNQKRYALGRGISSHLHAVHTPWKLSKKHRKVMEGERKRKINELRRKRKREQQQEQQGNDDVQGIQHQKDERKEVCMAKDKKEQQVEEDEMPKQQQPTAEQIRQWNERVVQLTAQLERDCIAQQQQRNNDSDETTPPSQPTKKRRRHGKNGNKKHSFVPAGYDRNGNKASSYKDSLHTFLKLASEGNLEGLRTFVSQEQQQREQQADDKEEVISTLLSTMDRNGSTAEHWAAGGGHLSCLEYLYELKSQVVCNNEKCMPKKDDRKAEKDNNDEKEEIFSLPKKRHNKRSGKTSLHFAARYGHNHILKYLLDHQLCHFPDVDVASGDGTTPLHLACYGGHYETVVLLIETYGANPNKVNDWGCSAAHWAAMSSSSSNISAIDGCDSNVLSPAVQICHYLKWKHSISFTTTQKQNHTPLHKAAQRLNSPVIEWYFRRKEDEGAGLTLKDKRYVCEIKDYEGGNKASDIWMKIGGDEEFGRKMKNIFGC